MHAFVDRSRFYFTKDFRFDLLAGGTVAVLAVPQSMSYAILAGLHPAYGLYTAMVATFVASLLRSSSHVISGTSTAVSVLTATFLAPYHQADNLYSTLFYLTFMTGLLQILFSLIRAGDLEHFVSPTVLIGFTWAAAVYIGFDQLPNLFGFSGEAHTHILNKVAALVRHPAGIHRNSMLLGCGTIVLVVLLRRISRYFPAYLGAIVTSAAIVYLFDLESTGVLIVGEIPRHLPSPRWFPIALDQLQELLHMSFALAVIGLVEGLSSAKIIASHTGQKIDANREFLGQGMANAIGSLFQNMPSGGSFARSALNFQTGARTRMAGVYAAITTALILLMFAPWARYIPVASLAAIVIVVSFQLVDRKRLSMVFHATQSDAIVVLSTFGAGILISIETAVYVGVIVSISLFLRKASVLDIKKLIQSSPRHFYEVDYDSDVDMEGFTILQIEGDLFFGAAGDLERKLERAFQPNRPFILRMKRTHNMDFAALEVLQRFNQLVRTNGGLLVLTGLEAGVKRAILKFGLDREVGTENVFTAGEVMFDAMQKAIGRCRAFLHEKTRSGEEIGNLRG